ncbi:hypothetical protein NPIL_410141 [Nephila pilipes]|uniref:Uncharacterized protein n=1 Tax=Nephila pilipes TaxID=299642 RepID=A0A8X6TGY1_NEPPI|nr:hypothetical protein NPIL_410141 [Nephila pilipes]
MWSSSPFQGSLLLCEDLSRNDNGLENDTESLKDWRKQIEFSWMLKIERSPLLCLIELSFLGERLPIPLEHNEHLTEI